MSEDVAWRGEGAEGHLKLTNAQDQAVRSMWNRAAEARVELDNTMRGLRDATARHGSALVGDQLAEGKQEVAYSLKGLDSLRRKVAVALEKGYELDETLQDVNDLNRYTLAFEPENYAVAAQETYERLKSQGYQPIPGSEKNTWEDPAYKGLNTTWQHQATGQRFELQFHTPDSFKAKTDNHELYEIARSGHFEQIAAGDRELARQYHQASDVLQNERYQKVVTPPGNEVLGERKVRSILNHDVPAERIEEVREMEAELRAQNARKAAAQAVPQQSGERVEDPGTAAQERVATRQSDAEVPNPLALLSDDFLARHQADLANAAQALTERTVTTAATAQQLADRYQQDGGETVARLTAAGAAPELIERARTAATEDVVHAREAAQTVQNQLNGVNSRIQQAAQEVERRAGLTPQQRQAEQAARQQHAAQQRTGQQSPGISQMPTPAPKIHGPQGPSPSGASL